MILSQRCRAIAGNEHLSMHLRDTGIFNFEQLLDAFDHIRTHADYVAAATDIFLAEPTSHQVLCLQLIVEEARALTCWSSRVRTRSAPAERSPLPRIRTLAERPPLPRVRHTGPATASTTSVVLTEAHQPAMSPPSSTGTIAQEILADLTKWAREDFSIAQLVDAFAAASWYSHLSTTLYERVLLISGCPNAGKSSLAANVATVLRRKTSSHLFWFYTKDHPPFLNAYHWSNDSFYASGEDIAWCRFAQSHNSIAAAGGLQRAIWIFEGHRILDAGSSLDQVTSVIILILKEDELLARGTSQASLARHKRFMYKHLEDANSLANGSRTVYLHASLPPPKLVLLAIEKMLRDCSNLSVEHMRGDLPIREPYL